MSGDAAYVRHIRDRCRAVGFWKYEPASGNVADYSTRGPGSGGTAGGTVTYLHRPHPLGVKVARIGEGRFQMSDSDQYTVGTDGFTLISWQWVDGSGDADQFVLSKTAATWEYGISYQNATTSPGFQLNVYQSGGVNHAVAGTAASPDPRGRWTMLWARILLASFVECGMNDGSPSARSTSFTGSYSNTAAGLRMGDLSVDTNGALTGNLGYQSIHPYLLPMKDIATAYRLGIGCGRPLRRAA